MEYQILIYVVGVGGVQGVQHTLHEVLLNPIISDSFGFSDYAVSWYFIAIILTLPVGALIL